MKKLLIICALFLTNYSISFSQILTKMWVFSDQAWTQQSVFRQNTSIDGLTILASDSSNVTIESTTKTYVNPTGTYGYSKLLRIGGHSRMSPENSNIPLTNAVAFDVNGPVTIEVACLSSSLDPQKLMISDALSWLGGIPGLPSNYRDSIGNELVFNTFHYAGGSNRLFLYAPGGSIDLYSLKIIGSIIPVQNVTFNVKVPVGTKECWLAGTFNNWNNAVTRMQMVDSLHYNVVVPVANMDSLRYKYLSGPQNWAYVEKGANGEEIQDRFYHQNDTVLSWASVYDSIHIISKNITFEVMVPTNIQTLHIAGSFNGWDPTSEGTQMDLKAILPNGKLFTKTIFINDISTIAYKYTAGPSWNYVQTQDNEFIYNNIQQDTILNNVFGFYQYTGDIQPREWNFSKSPFGENRTFTELANQSWLYIMGTQDYPIIVEANNKNNEQNHFQYRLKTGGSAIMNASKPYLPTTRALAFKAGGDCQIAVACLSSNATSNRELIISNGDSILGKIPAPGLDALRDSSNVPINIFNYKGPKTSLYLYSVNGGINMYYIGVSNGLSESPFDEPRMTYTVKVPQGTKEVYISGDFNGWNFYSMQQVDSITFQTTIWGANAQQGYKYLCGPDWQYRELAADSSEISNRTWKQIDLVERWADIPLITKIYYDNIETAAGDNFTLTLKSISNHPLQAISYQFEISYDPYLMEYTGYSTDSTLSKKGEIVVNSTTSWGRLYVSFMSSESLNMIGDLLKLNFRANNSTYYYDNRCWINNFYFDTNQIWDTESGNILIRAYKYGDVDGNQAIQAYDAALTLQYSVGKDPLPLIDPLPWEEWRLKAANVDGIEGITANDAAMILQYSAYLINKFDVEKDSTILRARANNLADVTITQEGSNLIFKSYGNLVGLNVYLKDQFNVLGEPVISTNIDLSAINKSENAYAVGLAALKSPNEGSVIMSIPILNNNETNLTFHLIINTDQKDVVVRSQVSTQLNSTLGTGISLYPNPALDILNVSNLLPNSQIAIYDISGRTIYSQKTAADCIKINISAFNSGLYTIAVSNEKGNIVSKFIKK